VYTYLLMIAQAAGAEGGAPEQPAPDIWRMLLPMLLIFAVFYFLLIMPQRRKEKQRQRDREGMLKNLSKNDHVVTIGGLHGIVASVSDDEVAIKVDEKSDVRIRVAREAISRVVTEDGAGAEGAKKLGDDSNKK
jgi:preprotein translocase subunit YajC